ncbi:MAG: hypothetical protein ACREQ7_17910 [Candidatus Binatia bacterium]
MLQEGALGARSCNHVFIAMEGAILVTGSHNSTDSLERTEQYFRTLSPRRSSGASEQFLSYDGAKIDARSVLIVNLTYERKSCSALNEVDVQVGVDQVLGH